MKKILILDFGSQYTQLIARKIRELGSYAEICSYDKSDFSDAGDIQGIILSGGPSSVHEDFSPKPNGKVFELGVPILGICYGLQLLAQRFGGKVEPADNREYGPATIRIDISKGIFANFRSDTSSVWMSHGDKVSEVSEEFDVLAHTEDAPFCGIQHKTEPIYGIQFHPEVHHSREGQVLLKNFLDICEMPQNWRLDDLEAYLLEEIHKTVGDSKVVLGLSGGVDSSVAAMLIHKAIGDRLTCIFVDNGLLRKEEDLKVEKMFKDYSFKLKIIDARKQFLDELKGISDPETKRKTIGRVFVDVFSAEAKKEEGIEFLAQGTLYPDVIESVSVKGPSATIKTHHNVGGLPEKMNLKLVEPLRYLFKDEVRRLGEAMGMAHSLLWRHPFPGPGLAVRILGEITEESLEILKEADDIIETELRNSGLYDRVWQCFGVLLPCKTVGVMGDERTYEKVLAIRSVDSVDAMTADWSRLPYELLAKFSNKIVSQVKGINRVVYDITSKPPGTIEWE